jgi:Tfp pilus assembly protein PilO
MTSLRRIVREKRRWVVPIALAAAANAVLYGAAVVPLQARVRQAAARAAAAAAALEQAKVRHRAAQATVERARRAQEALAKFYREVLPVDWPAARRIAYAELEARARRFNLRPTRTGSDSVRDEDSPLARLGVTMIVAGDYRNIREFLYDLESSRDFLVIENVSLAQSEQNEAPLVLTIEVATYYQAGSGGH